MFQGSYVALVTPFKDDESLDEAKLKELIQFQLDGGTHGIVPCGTTGESPALSETEHDRVIEITVETVNGRVPVIAGTGSNSTTRTLRATAHAKAAGADAALIVTPLLQQTDPRRSICPLHENRRHRGHPDCYLQRSGTLRDGHPVTNDRAACWASEHRRTQRGDW